eukprot:scaffold104411_cov29-Tisochrysis_lutea.AAC.1
MQDSKIGGSLASAHRWSAAAQVPSAGRRQVRAQAAHRWTWPSALKQRTSSVAAPAHEECEPELGGAFAPRVLDRARAAPATTMSLPVRMMSASVGSLRWDSGSFS